MLAGAMTWLSRRESSGVGVKVIDVLALLGRVTGQDMHGHGDCGCPAASCLLQVKAKAGAAPLDGCAVVGQGS